jgi:hypothetical protein
MMGVRKASKEQGRGMQRDYARFLIRNHVREHLRKTYHLRDQMKRHPQTGSISEDLTASLSNKYLLAANAL